MSPLGPVAVLQTGQMPPPVAAPRCDSRSVVGRERKRRRNHLEWVPLSASEVPALGVSWRVLSLTSALTGSWCNTSGTGAPAQNRCQGQLLSLRTDNGIAATAEAQVAGSKVAVVV